MRELTRVSVVFLCTDILTKKPIEDVVVFFDRKLQKIIKKRGGYCVFTDIYPGWHEIVLRAAGYNEEEMYLNLRENETRTIYVTMSYSKNDVRLYRLRRFEFHVFLNGAPLKNSRIFVILNNESEFFRLVKPIVAGLPEVYVNSEAEETCAIQHYLYEEKQEFDLFLTSYNYTEKCYLLEQPLNMTAEVGGKLLPYWILKTDNQGVAVLPFMPRFMTQNMLQFELRCDTGREFLNVDVNSIPEDNRYVLNVNFDGNLANGAQSN